MPLGFLCCVLQIKFTHFVLLCRKTYPFCLLFGHVAILVMWDMSIDPASSTVKHEWIWQEGGSYFGVPFSNFLGWFLCVYTVFQFWAIYLIRAKLVENFSLDSRKSSWYLPIFLYGSIFLQSIMAAALTTNGTVTDASSQVWPLRALYESLGLVSIFTMLYWRKTPR